MIKMLFESILHAHQFTLLLAKKNSNSRICQKNDITVIYTTEYKLLINIKYRLKNIYRLT